MISDQNTPTKNPMPPLMNLVEESGESSSSTASASAASATTAPASTFPKPSVLASPTLTIDSAGTLTPAASSTTRRRKVVTPWTRREDALLIEAIEKFGAKFAEVKRFVEQEGHGEVKKRAAFGYQSRWRILKKRLLI